MARPLTGTYRHNDDTPWAGGRVEIVLLEAFETAEAVYPPGMDAITLDQDGAMSTTLATPDTGTAHYEIHEPDGGTFETYIDSGPSVDIQTLRTTSTTAVDPDAAQVLIDAHLAAADPHAQYLLEDQTTAAGALDDADGLYLMQGGAPKKLTIASLRDYLDTLYAEPTNHVTNGSFEISTTGWSATNATLTSVHGGASGNCLKVANTDTIGCAWQRLTIPAGTYRIKLSMKNGSAAPRITISQNPYDYSGSYSADSAVVWWEGLSDAFTIAYDNPYINLFVNDVTAGAYAYFDEVSVVNP